MSQPIDMSTLEASLMKPVDMKIIAPAPAYTFSMRTIAPAYTFSMRTIEEELIKNKPKKTKPLYSANLAYPSMFRNKTSKNFNQYK